MNKALIITGIFVALTLGAFAGHFHGKAVTLEHVYGLRSNALEVALK